MLNNAGYNWLISGTAVGKEHMLDLGFLRTAVLLLGLLCCMCVNRERIPTLVVSENITVIDT